MKLTARILSLIMITGLTALSMACDKDDGDDKPQEEKQLMKLLGKWNLVSANDGGDRTDEFANLVLELSGTFVKGGTYQYKFTGTRPNPSPWPAEGIWKFGTNVSTQLIRDPGTEDETPMTYTVTDTQLTIEFNIPDGSTGFAGGTTRTQSVSGNWTFVFNKLP